jgi:hypothetical protein
MQQFAEPLKRTLGDGEPNVPSIARTISNTFALFELQIPRGHLGGTKNSAPFLSVT